MKNTLILFQLLWSSCAFAQSITYNSFDFGSGQPVSNLREMAADGTGDRALSVGLPEPGFPAWSRDGRLLALASPEPGRPNKLSRDIFILDAGTGTPRKISRFEDFADGNTFRKYFTTAQAFSPDGRRLAATVMLNTSVVNSGITTLPMVYLFDTSGAEPPVMLAAANLQDGINLEGYGCDWSSTNLIAWPGSCGSPFIYGGSTVSTVNGTAIFILQPNVNAPQARQLTFPVVRAEGGANYLLKRSEVDYAPAFSPDGNSVVYVRAVRSVELPQNTYPPDQCSIRVANINGTNDREILRLAAGLWVTRTAWSPDGSRLLFDLGPQQVINNIPYAQAAPGTVEIHALNMSTLTPFRVHAAPAVWPAWRPGTLPSAVPPALALRLVPGGNDIELAWPAGGAGAFQLQSNPALSGAWTNITATPTQENGVNRIRLPRGGTSMFFRLTGR